MSTDEKEQYDEEDETEEKEENEKDENVDIIKDERTRKEKDKTKALTARNDEMMDVKIT